MTHRCGIQLAHAALAAGRIAEGMVLLDEAENCGGPARRPSAREAQVPIENEIKHESEGWTIHH